jgi:predicted nucleotidyltransferase
MTDEGEQVNYLEHLRKLTGLEWGSIREAATKAEQTCERIRARLDAGGLVGPDTAMVVYGSLARGESTQGSDCDWTLLVDGQADGDHYSRAADIERAVEELRIAKPGRTGVFGSFIFSHDLVHQIGGEEDTNRNITRRMLLLLESRVIPVDGAELVRSRVVRQIIKRYLDEEPAPQDPEGNRRYPRFLLNDVVRYWRTMAVDYARKVRERNSEGWALRNIKLRLSRKLTFVSGMLCCFDSVLNPRGYTAELYEAPDTRDMGIQEHILEYVESTPLEILSRAIVLYSPDDQSRAVLASEVLTAYDSFLRLLDNEEQRNILKMLAPDAADADPTFQAGRRLGRQFQEGLMKLFYESNEGLADATKEYGVF